MKCPRIPETEIANWAFLPVGQKFERAYTFLRRAGGSGSYNPFRETIGDAVNRQLPLFQDGQVETPWSKLEETIEKKCSRDPKSLAMNVAVARATHEFSVERELTAEPVDFFGVATPLGFKYDFGLPLFLRYEGGASVAFPDLRRSGGLTHHGIHVAHSFQHQRFRENFPDNEGLRLEVWRYRNNDGRDIEVCRSSGSNLISLDELLADVVQTYEVVAEVLAAIAAEERRRPAAGGSGPLFGGR